MRGIARFEARLEAIEIGKKPALDAELRMFLASLGPARTVALSHLAIEGKALDLAALEHLGPASQNRNQHADFAGHLRGRIAHALLLNRQRGAKLKSLFDQIDWTR